MSYLWKFLLSGLSLWFATASYYGGWSVYPKFVLSAPLILSGIFWTWITVSVVMGHVQLTTIVKDPNE